MDVLFPKLKLFFQLMYIQHHHLRAQRLFLNILSRNNMSFLLIPLKIPEKQMRGGINK